MNAFATATTLVKPVTLKKVYDARPMLGCDPEFFFKNKGAIIGAEKVIPLAGISHKALHGTGTSKFIIDGVQAELNPSPSTCRAYLANEIAACFKVLKAELAKQGTDIQADFSRAVEISKENLAELEEKSRMFGCAPSKSIYRKRAGIAISKIDPTEYRVRAAGGHIHIGASANYPEVKVALKEDYKRIVHMLDILCGNTAVLVDRDPANIERRKVYGRAGEFRLPPHGVEYRTLSNFWLTAYPLMSFAFAMARLAVQVMSDKKNKEEYYHAFTDAVKTRNIHKAINNNDFDLAMDNFKRIENILRAVTHEQTASHPISNTTMSEFYHLVNKIQSDGLSAWFKQDPLTHWTTMKEAHDGGFYDFLTGPVRTDMYANKAALSATAH